MNTIFIIGIGGTGMKCLESFVHLCAMGMMDEHEIHLLALDTDIQNGNFSQLKRIVGHYNTIKGNSATQTSTKDSFFTAKIKLYSFSPDYSTATTNTFQNITGLTSTQEPIETDLANAFFTKNVQEFNLLHGYRAQTHIGSMLMYHAMVQDGIKTTTELYEFTNQLNNCLANNPSVFVMGSVFGGTGASTIPILPLALNEICRISYQNNVSQARFGAILLTNYFTFGGASDSKKAAEKVIADAANFAINSQAALMFYESDTTVKNTYKRFYTLGIGANKALSVQDGASEPITGGANQRNNAHYIELVAAGAAYDFFMAPNDGNYNVLPNTPLYLYREVEDGLKLDFKDIINDDKFIKACTLFTVTSFLVNLRETDFFTRSQMTGAAIDHTQVQKQVDSLKAYFDFFHFKIDNNQIVNGWLRQLHTSVGSSDKLFFTAGMYGTQLSKFDFHQIFSIAPYNQHNFKTGWLTGNAAAAFDSFKSAFKKEPENNSSADPAERLLKRMHDTLKKLYKFK